MSESRLEKARGLFMLKKKDNIEIELLDCLQFIDYGTIIKKNFSKFQEYFDCDDSKIEKNFKKLRMVRDSISHSEKIQSNWKETFELLRFVKYTLEKM